MLNSLPAECRLSEMLSRTLDPSSNEVSEWSDSISVGVRPRRIRGGILIAQVSDQVLAICLEKHFDVDFTVYPSGPVLGAVEIFSPTMDRAS